MSDAKTSIVNNDRVTKGLLVAITFLLGIIAVGQMHSRDRKTAGAAVQ